jgi:hypothetical protein
VSVHRWSGRSAMLLAVVDRARISKLGLRDPNPLERLSSAACHRLEAYPAA